MSGTAGVKVAMVDPSGFTLPYDHCLATALAQKGCQVVLVTTHVPPGAWTETTVYERWEHFYQIAGRLPRGKIRTYLKGLEHPFDMEKLLRRLWRWRPDIIHFQWVPFPAVDRLFLWRFRKIAPLVLTVHDTVPFHGAPSSPLQLVGLTSAFKCFDHYIVHTQYSKKSLMSQLMLPERRVAVIPHGVLAYYRELVRGLGESGHSPQLSGKKKILFFGLLKPYKGVDVLLEAFARLPEPVAKDTILQIVGYPKMAVEPLQSLAHHLGLENRVLWDIRFVEEKEVAAYFSQADVVVLPYRKIDQSGVLMVALAFGKPIVASRVGGFAEILGDEVHGVLVAPGDVEALAQALARVLVNDKLRSQMVGAVERLASEELAWNNIAEQTAGLYREVLDYRR